MQKDGYIVCAIMAVLTIGTIGCNQQKDKDEEMVIGAILPLTGVVADAGKDMLNGLLLAKENFEEDGVKITLKVEDGKYTSKDSINCFNKLILGAPHGIIVAGQVPASSVKPMIKKSRIPAVATIAGGKEIPCGNEYIARCYFSSYEVGAMIATYASSNLAIKTCGILKIDNDWGVDAAAGFNQEFSGSVVAEETFVISDHDVKSQVSKILTKNPDAVFVTGFGPGFSTSFNRLIEAGYKGKILTDPQILEPAYQKNIKEIRGIYYVCSAFDNKEDNKLVSAFREKYVKRFNVPPSLFSAFAYSSLQVLLNRVRGNGWTYSADTPIGHISVNYDGEITVPLIVGRFQ